MGTSGRDRRHPESGIKTLILLLFVEQQSPPLGTILFPSPGRKISKPRFFGFGGISRGMNLSLAFAEIAAEQIGTCPASPNC
jgi:hypothetical protein